MIDKKRKNKIVQLWFGKFGVGDLVTRSEKNQTECDRTS